MVYMSTKYELFTIKEMKFNFIFQYIMFNFCNLLEKCPVAMLRVHGKPPLRTHFNFVTC